MRTRHPALTALAVIAALTTTAAARAQHRAEHDAEPHAEHRMVYRFDFDERDDGNLEDIPKYWTRLDLPSFPHFPDGRFDGDRGHDDAPSFALRASGRNLAYQYNGPDTRVRRNTDYRIEAYVRTTELVTSRACLSAHFLDHNGDAIPGTMARTPYIGDRETGGEWLRLEFYLPSAPAHARTICLTAWVLEEPTWSTAIQGRRHIRRRDVNGVAWFDDIAIYALPRVSLATSGAGNVITAGESPALRVLVADFEDTSLSARLSVYDATGELATLQQVTPSIGPSARTSTIPLDDLPVGHYHAILDVFASGEPIVSRRLTFAVVAPRPAEERAAAGRSFGVVIQPSQRTSRECELALLEQSGTAAVKVPAWSGLPEEPLDARERRDDETFLQELVRHGFIVTGVLAGPPGPLVLEDGPFPRPLLEMLAGPAEIWIDYLAAVVVPNAGVFHRWQIGPDDGIDAYDEHLPEAVANLDDALGRYITSPRIALMSRPWHGAQPPVDRVEHMTLRLGPEAPDESFKEMIDAARHGGRELVSVYLAPPADGRFRRMAYLARWSQRVISARFAGASTVFVPQPWRVRRMPYGEVAEPTENYLFLRTIAQVLGSSVPITTVDLAPGVKCMAFRDGDDIVQAIWDNRAPLEGREHVIQLGAATHVVDGWGHRTALQRDTDGRHRIRLSPLPVFVRGTEPWLIDLRGSVRLDPPFVAGGTELLKPTLDIQYRGRRPVTGTIAIDGPESWEFARHAEPLQLTPQRRESKPLKMKLPHNAVAGQVNLRARLKLSSPLYALEIPLLLELGLKDVDVRGLAFVDGRDVVLVHAVTNRSTTTLDLRSTANVPGRERQYRPFTRLRPGESQFTEYRFANAASLHGREVQLSIRELNDGPRVHNIRLLIP